MGSCTFQSLIWSLDSQRLHSTQLLRLPGWGSTPLLPVLGLHAILMCCQLSSHLKPCQPMPSLHTASRGCQGGAAKCSYQSWCFTRHPAFAARTPRTWSLGSWRLHPKEPFQRAREGLRNFGQRLGQPRPDRGSPPRGLHPVHHPEPWGCIAGLGWQLEPLGWRCRGSFGPLQAGTFSSGNAVVYHWQCEGAQTQQHKILYPESQPQAALACTSVCHLKLEGGLSWAQPGCPCPELRSAATAKQPTYTVCLTSDNSCSLNSMCVHLTAC